MNCRICIRSLFSYGNKLSVERTYSQGFLEGSLSCSSVEGSFLLFTFRILLVFPLCDCHKYTKQEREIHIFVSFSMLMRRTQKEKNQFINLKFSP